MGLKSNDKQGFHGTRKISISMTTFPGPNRGCYFSGVNVSATLVRRAQFGPGVNLNTFLGSHYGPGLLVPNHDSWEIVDRDLTYFTVTPSSECFNSKK